MWYSIPRQQTKEKHMATRLERLEESLVKAHARIEEIQENIQAERTKVMERKDEEMKKFLEQKAKFEALYGKLPEDMNVQNG